MQADAHGIGRDAENRSRFGLAETVPHQQTEQFLIVGSHPGERFEGRRLNPMDRRDSLRLGAESEAKPEATARSTVLIGQNPAGDGQQPWQRGFRLRQAVNPTPGHREGLGHRVLGVGLGWRASKGVGENGAMVPPEGGLKAREGRGAHKARDDPGSPLVPAAPRATSPRSCGSCARCER